MSDALTQMRSVEQAAVDTLRDEATQVARAAADAACNLVVSDEASAVMANEYLHKIGAGKRYLERRQAELTAPWRRAADAIRNRLGAVVEELDRGDKAIRRSLANYIDAQKKAAEAERRRLEAEAATQAEGFSSLGEDAPPPMQVTVPEPQRKIEGPSGSVHATKVLELEVVDWSEVPEGWRVLATAIARAEWTAAVKRGEVSADGQVWRGVRFSYRTSVRANR